jgi:tellurite methyltransferase
VSRPFWEDAYQDVGSPSPFGATSEEIRALAPGLPAGARVLDLGCGDGRNSVFLLRQGFEVTAVDVSPAAIAKLAARAEADAPRLRTVVQDVRQYTLPGRFDLVVAHGLLHLLPREDWAALIGRMRAATSSLGYNVVAVFTDRLPPPPDLEAFTPGLFREGELRTAYEDWSIELYRSYELEDE